ncbi:MAG: hypothetical protein J3K34DRAFT_251143 [Monoraphidium minutum]|nr:MAG: hypothetical protein J3K34DRAFT_251143 [Monoraphidium minutum]
MGMCRNSHASRDLHTGGASLIKRLLGPAELRQRQVPGAAMALGLELKASQGMLESQISGRGRGGGAGASGGRMAPAAAAAAAPRRLSHPARYAAMLLRGEKTIELRRYAMPDSYIGRAVLLLATPDGDEGRSTLPDVITDAAQQPGLTVAGAVVFGGQVVYESHAQFAADERLHRVPPEGTPYGWTPGVTQVLYGWQVERVEAAVPKHPQGPMRRVLSSWFEEEEESCLPLR